MQISVLRKGSIGIKGTYQNVAHHAKPILVLVAALEDMVGSWGFDQWQQGHNVHLLTTDDKRVFSIRGYQTDEGYIGIQVFARASRSVEIPLCVLFADNRDGMSINDFNTFMCMLAKSPKKSKFSLSRE